MPPNFEVAVPMLHILPKLKLFPLMVMAASMTCGEVIWSLQPITADEPAAAGSTAALTTDSQSRMMADRHSPDESAGLGIVLGPCPGKAVCVLDTIWGSPADEAGIHQGDYITRVNGDEVSSPTELKETIDKLDAGTKVTLLVWRDGQEMMKEVAVANMATEPPVGHQAWLGVKLSAATAEGVMVSEVLRDSPAADAGLRTGDTITMLNDKPVGNIQSFVDQVADLGPGTEVQLTLKRGGNDQRVPVTLGSIDEAPMRYLREAMRPPMNDQPMSGMQSSDMLDQTLDEMRRQIRELQGEVSELRGDDVIQPAPASDPAKGASLNRDHDETLVIQRGRIYRNNRSATIRGNNYLDWQNRYRTYRQPLYSSPRNNYGYYRYGGNPYYYGGYSRGYGYGRPGVQVGNLGVYWY